MKNHNIVKKGKTQSVHFRCDTPRLFKEINDGVLKTGNFGVLKIPLQIFFGLLEQVALRGTQLNDPILDRIFFDLNLYELPSPSSKEYGILMKKVYAAEKKYKKLNNIK